MPEKSLTKPGAEVLGPFAEPCRERRPSAPVSVLRPYTLSVVHPLLAAQPVKPQKLYSVTAAFGAAPPGPLQPGMKLARHANLERQQVLPSSKQPLVVFRGVRAGGKSAIFTLVGEALLRGAAACVPGPSQCQAISLKQGQTEELEFLKPDGTAVTYQLKLLSVARVKASAAAARRLSGTSKAGDLVLSRNGLGPLPGLRYSPRQGVLVPAGNSVAAVNR